MTGPVATIGCIMAMQCLCGKCSPGRQGEEVAPEAIDRGPWIQTYTGRRVHPFHPTPDSIDILDIAHALSNLCRFTGHTEHFYSVAQHCVHMADAAPADVAPQALLHDAAEAYFNDLAHPIKTSEGMQAYQTAEEMLMGGIFVRFGLPRAIDARIAELDAGMLAAEYEHLIRRSWHDDLDATAFGIRAAPLISHIPQWTPGRAKDAFLNRFYHLFPLEFQP